MCVSTRERNQFPSVLLQRRAIARSMTSDVRRSRPPNRHGDCHPRPPRTCSTARVLIVLRVGRPARGAVVDHDHARTRAGPVHSCFGHFCLRGKQRRFRGGRLDSQPVGDVVRCSGNDQFPRAGGAARSAKIRQLSEAFAASSNALAIQLAAFELSRASQAGEMTRRFSSGSTRLTGETKANMIR